MVVSISKEKQYKEKAYFILWKFNEHKRDSFPVVAYRPLLAAVALAAWISPGLPYNLALDTSFAYTVLREFEEVSISSCKHGTHQLLWSRCRKENTDKLWV